MSDEQQKKNEMEELARKRVRFTAETKGSYTDSKEGQVFNLG